MTTDIDELGSSLLEEAKRFLELSGDCEDAAGTIAYRHAALMMSFCALEAHVSAIVEDFSNSCDLTVHERGLIGEKRVRLKDGAFELTSSLEMVRLEDRIQFLHRKFSGRPLDRQSSWWADLGSAMNLRNNLTHPKGGISISRQEIENAVQAIVSTIDALYRAIYKRAFPAASLGLQSKLTFR